MRTCGFDWGNLCVSIAAVVVFNLLTPFLKKHISNDWIRWIVTFALTCIIVLVPYAVITRFF